MSASGFFMGVLGLAGLEVLVSSPHASQLVGGVGSGAATVVQRLISPDLGLIPNLHDAGSTASSSTAQPPNPPAADPNLVRPRGLPTRAARSGGLIGGAGKAPIIAKGTG